MIRACCDGRDCRETVGPDEEERQRGWTVVVSYPLNGDGEQRRHLLCRVCSRRQGVMFKDD